MPNQSRSPTSGGAALRRRPQPDQAEEHAGSVVSCWCRINDGAYPDSAQQDRIDRVTSAWFVNNAVAYCGATVCHAVLAGNEARTYDKEGTLIELGNGAGGRLTVQTGTRSCLSRCPESKGWAISSSQASAGGGEAIRKRRPNM